MSKYMLLEVFHSIPSILNTVEFVAVDDIKSCLDLFHVPHK